MDRGAGGGAVSGDGGDGDGGDGGGDGGVGGGGCGGCDGCCGGGDEDDSGGDGEGAADAPWGASSHHNTSARHESIGSINCKTERDQYTNSARNQLAPW